jgi:hypothetical protein
VQGSGCKVQCLGLRVQDAGFINLGLEIHGLGGLGVGVWDVGVKGFKFCILP